MENQGITKKQIEKRAYELYMECGCDGGHDLEHWLAAEAELTQPKPAQSEPIPQKTRAAMAGGPSQSTTRS